VQPTRRIRRRVKSFQTRWIRLCARLGCVGTLFVVAADVRNNPALVASLHRAVAAGHELANHSDGHDYRMSTWDQARIVADLEHAQQTLAPIGGVPRGFRAPGYNMTEAMWASLHQLGFAWDSSQLSSLAYFGVRAAAIARSRWRRQPSASLVGDWQAFATPLRPLDRSCVEVPISVSWQVPLTGTAMVLLPAMVMERVVAGCRSSRGTSHQHVCIELHAVDVVATDHLDEARLQPDLAIDHHTKLSRIERICRMAMVGSAAMTISAAVARSR
jgi:peptidoglycan-N-acetylglucosamine deacetylase